MTPTNINFTPNKYAGAVEQYDSAFLILSPPANIRHNACSSFLGTREKITAQSESVLPVTKKEGKKKGNILKKQSHNTGRLLQVPQPWLASSHWLRSSTRKNIRHGGQEDPGRKVEVCWFHKVCRFQFRSQFKKYGSSLSCFGHIHSVRTIRCRQNSSNIS